MFRSQFKILLMNNTSYLTQKRLNWTMEKCMLFEDLFGLPALDVKKYVCKHKIPSLSEEHLISNAAILKKMGGSSDDWLKYPDLLQMRGMLLEKRYLQLKEGGFTNVDSEVLIKYRKCVNKKISFLKQFNLIASDVNVAESFVSYLFPQPDYIRINDLTDDSVFHEVHYAVVTRYLMWKFEATEEEINKFYQIYGCTSVKSLDFLCQTFYFLKELGYSPKKLMKCGYLLLIHPQTPKEIIDTFSKISKLDFRYGMSKYPKLIGVSLTNCIEIYNFLKESNISDSTIQNAMNIFELGPSTIKLRLSEMMSIPELKVFLDDPRMLKLIVRHNQSRSKVSFLQMLKHKCFSYTTISGSEDNFKIRIESGADMHSSSEVVSLLNRLLHVTDDTTVITNLRKHRFYRNIPLVEIEKNYKLLTNLRFNDVALREAVQVLLYPSQKLQEMYKKVCKMSMKYRQPSKVEQLNLIIYLIEKEHSFTGNGVWDNFENE